MDNIIRFYKSNPKYTDKLNFYKEKVISEWQNFLFKMNNSDLKIDDCDNKLYNSFLKIIDRAINNTWLDNESLEMYLNYLDQISGDDLLFNILVYTNLVDQDKNKILNADFDIISVVVSAIADSKEINIKDYKKIYNIYLDSEVQELLDNSVISLDERKDILISCIDEWQTGYMNKNTILSEIDFSIPTKEELRNELIKNNFSTCSQIYNYCKFKYNFYNVIFENIFDMEELDLILKINNLPRDEVKKYIEEVNNIIKKDYNSIYEIKCIMIAAEVYTKDIVTESRNRNENRRFRL